MLPGDDNPEKKRLPDWLEGVPWDLRKQLTYDPSTTVDIPNDAIVLLYVGDEHEWKNGEDWPALDVQIKKDYPEIVDRLVVIEMKRCKRTNNMLRPEPYNSLCTAAEEGRIQQVSGGPNCKTWSVKRLKKTRWGGKPCRGRSDELCWGLPELSEADRKKDKQETRNDSLLLLRLLFIQFLAKQSGSLKAGFVEHPVDPADEYWGTQGWIPGADQAPSIWATSLMQKWLKAMEWRKATFHQGCFGQETLKATTIAHDYDQIENEMDGKWTSTHKKYVGGTNELARYPPIMMGILARAVALASVTVGEKHRITRVDTKVMEA